MSGGIGAELSDGNFWEGAIIGGVVAGLNHSLHKFSEQQRQKYILENQLEAEGYDPWGKPTVTKEYAQKMMDKVQILKHQNDLAGGRGKISGFVNSDDYHGKVNVNTGDIYLAKNSLSTASNMSLATVIYHELKHLVYHWNPNFSSLLKYSGKKRSDYQHFLIYSEINNVLLNRSLTFGTRDALNQLNKMYGWKY